MQRYALVLCLFLLWSCKGSSKDGDYIDPESGIPINDQTEQHPAAPEGGYQIATPTMTVQPYSEIIFCYYGTYNGPDVGVVDFIPFTHPMFNHHSFLRTQLGDEGENGELIDCTNPPGDPADSPPEGGPGMPGGQTLIQTIQVEGEQQQVGDWLTLPEGYAVKLESGTRWVIDTHFINPTDEIVLVNDTMNLGFLPAEEVTNWVAALQFSGVVHIPPETEWTRSFDCVWDEDYEILSLFGHLHHLGKRFTTDWTHDGETERVYEVDPWLPEYRENPRNVIQSYAPGEFKVKAGDVFTIHCTWDNPSASGVEAPEEMCSLHGAIGPSEVPLTCADQDDQ